MLVVLKMAADKKRQHCHSVDEEEEEEALSLCDLPVNSIKENERSGKEEEEEEEEEAPATQNNEEDFDFVPWGGRFSTETSEMCAADDIFFRGQILPFRLSVGSETSFNKFSRQDSLNTTRQSILRSESMGHVSLGRSASFSSRSSSSRSHQSSSSTSSSIAATARIRKPRISNQFITHPSPKPQIRPSIASLDRNPECNGTRKSSTWDILKRGLVRTPEIKLQDLKVRSSVSRNSSSSSTNGSSNLRSQNFSQISHIKDVERQRKQRALINGCSCSDYSVVALNTLVIKSTVYDVNDDNSGRVFREERLKESKIKKQMAQKHQAKQAMSRHRTFEWLRQL